MKLLLVFCCALAAGASPIDIQLTEQETCDVTCRAGLAFLIPQVSGQVTSATFSVTDDQVIGWGYNNMYQPAEPMTVNLEGSLNGQSDMTGLAVSVSGTECVGNSGCEAPLEANHQIGFAWYPFNDTLSATGSFTDPESFEGTGYTPILLYAEGSTGGSMYTGVDYVWNDTTLDVTLDLTDVPEPRWIGLAALALIATAGLPRLRRVKEARSDANDFRNAWVAFARA